MEINKIHSDLKKIYQDKKESDRAFLFKFKDEDENEKLITLLKMGFWSVVPLGFYSDNILAIRLTPEKPLKKSPIVFYNGTYQECYTFAPNLQAIIPMSYLKFMGKPKVIAELQDKIEGAVTLSKPFFDYLGGGDLDFLKQFLLSEANQERLKDAANFEDAFFKEFWDHYYDTPEQKKAFELFEKLKEKRTYFPSYEHADYGLWNEYVGNVLANRAYELLNMEDEYKWPHYWHCVKLPHGFDCDTNGFHKYVISLGNSGSFVRDIAEVFDSEWEDKYAMFPEEVQKHPLFEATETIKFEGYYGYTGEKHLAAAARLEEEYKDPVAAWKALISASYWGGRRERLDIVEKAWQQAIDLSEKNGWIEINEVLMDQLEFYNHYKDKI
ncbi:hypothetical protein [Flavobacterium sp. CAU 1735]|uniref:hypothetical protein n=1 Tax=Flavobacterium sp. CAU 1735 TaxID=3140361 RepID=UPI0032613DF9